MLHGQHKIFLTPLSPCSVYLLLGNHKGHLEILNFWLVYQRAQEASSISASPGQFFQAWIQCKNNSLAFQKSLSAQKQGSARSLEWNSNALIGHRYPSFIDCLRAAVCSAPTSLWDWVENAKVPHILNGPRHLTPKLGKAAATHSIVDAVYMVISFVISMY